MLNTNWQSIEYNAQTALMDLAERIADTRKRSVRDSCVDQAAKIRYFLKAAEYKTTYLEDLTVNNIYQCLIDAAGIQDYPTVPLIGVVTAPAIITGIKGDKGDKGDRGEDGGATDFLQVNVGSDTVVDSFNVGDAYAVRWDYLVNGTPQRAGTIMATWTEDGANLDWYETNTNDINGSTSGVTFTVDFFGGLIRLNAVVTSGTWTITGSRYFIPNSGAFQSTPSALANGQIFIGDTSNLPQPRAVTGDVLITNTGVTSINTGVIVNTDVNASAAIAVTKLAALTPSLAVATDSSGFLTTVTGVSSTEVGYLSNVTSDIQAQLDGKVGSITGAISTVVSVDLTVNRAVISNASGKIAVSATTSTELGYVSGVTSAIQTQLNAKIGGSTGSTDNRILRADGTGGFTAQSSSATIDDSGNITLGTGGTENTITPASGTLGVIVVDDEWLGIRNSGDTNRVRITIGSLTPTNSIISSGSNGTFLVQSGSSQLMALYGGTNGNISILPDGGVGTAVNSNISLLKTDLTSFGSGKGVIYIAGANTVPTGNPSNGIYTYVESGVWKWRDPSGNIYPLNLLSGASGTTNTITKFTSPTSIGNSTITDNGSVATATGVLTVNGDFSVGTSPDSINKVTISGSARIYSGQLDVENGIISGSGNTLSLKWKKIDLGDWNMDSTGSYPGGVTHGISSGRTKILAVKVSIHDDLGTSSYDFLIGASEIRWTDTSIALSRNLGGFFDSTSFDGPVASRGIVTIFYF